MSLYWPEQKVALEIVDDPLALPFDRKRHPDVTVIETTCEEVDTPEGMDRLSQRLYAALGVEPVELTPEEDEMRRTIQEFLFADMPRYWEQPRLTPLEALAYKQEANQRAAAVEIALLAMELGEEGWLDEDWPEEDWPEEDELEG